MAKKISLEKLTEKLAAAEKERATLAAMEPQLRSDSEKLLGELQGLPVAKLLLPSAGESDLDAATDLKLRQLKFNRTKLELLPGHRDRLTREIAELGEEIDQAISEGVAELMTLSRQRLDAETAEWEAKLMPSCGGDAVRTRAAVKAVVEQLESKRWHHVLQHPIPGATPAERGREFLRLRTAFEAAKPFAAAA